jgi:hypothetical protein
MGEFKTSDLYEAAFLYAQGCNLVGLEGSQQKWFVFEGKERCEQLSTAFWSKKGEVNAKNYADSIRTLKDRLFAQK